MLRSRRLMKNGAEGLPRHNDTGSNQGKQILAHDDCCRQHLQDLQTHQFRRKRKRPNKSQLFPSFWCIFGCICLFIFLEICYIVSTGPISYVDLIHFALLGFGQPSTSNSAVQSMFLDKIDSNGIRIPMSENIKPLDDYYSRSHIHEPVPLIVGGSDGSGTRAFAHILEQLNVPLLVEDRGTMDVHAKIMYDGAGWPALVGQVLNETRSASYDLKRDIGDKLRDSALVEMNKIFKSVEISTAALISATEHTKTWATSVSWAFKAPVSILLLPFFRYELPKLKVLHIVRDGRDVALSENHSPVQKFFSSYYADAAMRNEMLMNAADSNTNNVFIRKAMQLWNDWNTQAFEYGRRYSDGETMDVLVLRAEDLVHYPLETIVLLADFVGSLKTPLELCCLSRMSLDDMGKSGGGSFNFNVDQNGQAGFGTGFSNHNIDPKSFSDVHKRFMQFAPKRDQHRGKQTAKLEHRRLLNVEDESKTKNLFNSGGRVVSGVFSDKQAEGTKRRDDAIAELSTKDETSHVAKMQQILEKFRTRDEAERTERESQDQVKMRYGKWRGILKSDHLLSHQLHLDGMVGLKLFGYEPPREFLDYHPRGSEVLPSCDNSISCE